MSPLPRKVGSLMPGASRRISACLRLLPDDHPAVAVLLAESETGIITRPTCFTCGTSSPFRELSSRRLGRRGQAQARGYRLRLHVPDRLLAPVHTDPRHPLAPAEARRDPARERWARGTTSSSSRRERPAALRGRGRASPAAPGAVAAGSTETRARGPRAATRDRRTEWSV